MKFLLTSSAVAAVITFVRPCVCAASILIVRGLLETPPPPDSEMTSAKYRIVELGRGSAETSAVEVIFMTTLHDERRLPADAILLLEKVKWGESSKSKGRGVYVSLGHDPGIGIRPYDEQAWATILHKSDEELAATPLEAQLKREDAVGVLRTRVFGNYAPARHLYIYPPRRLPFGWSLSALFVRNGAVKELKVRISDRGNIISEIPNRRPIKFFDSTDVSAEEMELFVRDYHRNTPPDEWPMWDPEPPPTMSGNAAEEHGVSVPLPRNSGPMP